MAAWQTVRNNKVSQLLLPCIVERIRLRSSAGVQRFGTGALGLARHGPELLAMPNLDTPSRCIAAIPYRFTFYHVC